MQPVKQQSGHEFLAAAVGVTQARCGDAAHEASGSSSSRNRPTRRTRLRPASAETPRSRAGARSDGLTPRSATSSGYFFGLVATRDALLESRNPRLEVSVKTRQAHSIPEEVAER